MPTRPRYTGCWPIPPGAPATNECPPDQPRPLPIIPSHHDRRYTRSSSATPHEDSACHGKNSEKYGKKPSPEPAALPPIRPPHPPLGHQKSSFFSNRPPTHPACTCRRNRRGPDEDAGHGPRQGRLPPRASAATCRRPGHAPLGSASPSAVDHEDSEKIH